jgi:2,3-bisphosphoglycerate-dependent phosphoglycerate mutase
VYYITFLRHGESEGNCSRVIQGQSDYPLTQAGIQQARDLARHWKAHEMQFDLIISSPLKRASQTAEIIGNALKVRVELDPAWKERCFGALQESNLDEIDHNHPTLDFFHPYDPIGGNGESQVDLYSRASLALQRIIRQPAGSYLVVSHGAILNKALYVILGITPQGHYNSPIFHFSNTGYAQFRYNSTTRQWAVLSFNNQLADEQIEGQNSWQQD